MGDSIADLPPGFRFHPTDEEIITHYLREKFSDKGFSSRAIGEVDLNRCEPWDLPGKAKMGEKEWYFFCQRDRKYPTGMRTNRATETGYWKATGKDKEIYKGRNFLVGMKKTLVFYLGRAPKGEKTNWVMHEYRLEGKSLHYDPPRSSKDDWVVCRVFHKNAAPKKGTVPELTRIDSFGTNLAFADECINSLNSPPLPSLQESPYCNSGRPSSSGLADDGGTDVGEFKIRAFVTASTDPSQSAPSSLAADDSLSLQKYFVPNSNIYGSSSVQHLYPANVAGESMFYPQAPGVTPYYSVPTSAHYSLHHHGRISGLLSYQTAPAPMRGNHPMVEQYSNQSLVSASQDTGLSTDRNTEISSGMSKNNYIDYPSCSPGPVPDMADLWEY